MVCWTFGKRGRYHCTSEGIDVTSVSIPTVAESLGHDELSCDRNESHSRSWVLFVAAQGHEWVVLPLIIVIHVSNNKYIVEKIKAAYHIESAQSPRHSLRLDVF